MPSVIFDFDSTLISCESLEEMLKAKLADRPDLQESIANITRLGMEGKIDFRESLEQRLKIAAPSRQEIKAFSQTAIRYLTPGMKNLIGALHLANIKVWIVSGALRESILDLASQLRIPEHQVLAIEADWNSQGEFIGIRPKDPFAISKVNGCKPYAKAFGTLSIAVGDGMTDYQLYASGLVKHFIAFTQHAKREAVLEKAPFVANNTAELKQTLMAIIKT